MENLLVVVSEIFGHSDITSFTADDRSEVSIAHKISFSLGGSTKMHELKKRSGIEKGVGHDRFPIHTMRNGGSCS